MPKKKSSIALFEVIQKARRAGMEVPRWMAGREAPVASSPQAAPPASGAPAAPARAARPIRALAEPLIRVAGTRIRFSASYVQCVAAGVAVAVLVVGAYALGVWGGRATAPARGDGDNGNLSQRTPLGQHVIGGEGGRPAGRAPTPPAAAGTRQDGKLYLVIQSLAGASQADFDEATRIAEWCKQRGEAATVARYTAKRSNTPRYIVWSLKPFDSFSAADAQAYARRIEELGKEYFAKSKTYDFRQRSAGGKFDPWFEKFEQPR